VHEMKDNAYNYRLRLVESARQRGLKPTAKLFATTVPTVRKWLRLPAAWPLRPARSARRLPSPVRCGSIFAPALGVSKKWLARSL
jgi:hypothetical protein